MGQPTILVLEVSLWDGDKADSLVEHLAHDARVLDVKVLSE